jgi:hypothetical protein
VYRKARPNIAKQIILDKSDSTEIHSAVREQSLRPRGQQFELSCRMSIALAETRPNMDWNLKTAHQRGLNHAEVSEPGNGFNHPQG